jgi:RNA polymerase sigma factor (sigma-70 family)
MEAATKQTQLTDRQLREAEAGLLRLLQAKRFPRRWIKESVSEIMAQASTDFAARLAVEHVEDAVSLLVVIAYRRAIKLVRTERSRPHETSIDSLFHLADESTPTPEQETLDHDRQETLVKAMGELPERERQLLSLIYFKEMQIGEAGRRVGWAKASATRHHQAALERLRELVGDRELLGIEIAIPAFVASRDHAAPRAALIWMEGAAETVREAVALGAGRYGPLAETGNAAAMGGTARTAGVCGAAVVACLAGAAGGVVGPGIGALDAKEAQLPSHAHHARETSATSALRELPAVRPEGRAAAGSARPPRGPSEATAHQRPASRPISGPRGRGATTDPPTASARQTVNEFGLESGEAEETASPPASATENTPVSPQSPVAARPTTSSSGEGTSKPSGSSSAGSQTSAEFGM